MANLYGTDGDDILVYNRDERFVQIFGRGGNDTAIVPLSFAESDVEQFIDYDQNGNIFSVTGVTGNRADDGNRFSLNLYSTENIRFLDGDVRIGDNDPLFDPVFYYQRNPDVYASGVDARDHYNQIGWKEGRDPNRIFDTSEYLETYGDVAASGINPLDHYRAFGATEGRDVSSDGVLGSYLKLNPDLLAAGVDPLAHFLEFGQYEGRNAFIGEFIGRDIDSDGFDSEYYLWMNPDVGQSGISARDHYMNIGYLEGRRPNAVFDPLNYLAANPDVAAAGLEPLTHYDQFGIDERRDDGGNLGDFYYDERLDVIIAGVNIVKHYLDYGIYEQEFGNA